MFSYLCEISFSVSCSEGHSKTFILFILKSKACESSYQFNNISAALWSLVSTISGFSLLSAQVPLIQQSGKVEISKLLPNAGDQYSLLTSFWCPHPETAGQIPCAGKARACSGEWFCVLGKDLSRKTGQCLVLWSRSHNSISFWYFTVK